MGYDMFIEEPDAATQAATTARSDAYKALTATYTAEEWEAVQAMPNPAYFRLSIGAMSRWRDWMVTFGMLVDHPDAVWPPYPDCTGEPDDDTRCPACTEYERQCEAVHATRLGAIQPGIPYQKLCDNSGWHVMPVELDEALDTYDGIPRARVEDVIAEGPTRGELLIAEVMKREPELRSAEDITGDLADWDEWIAFLRRAARMGGLRVC